MNKDTLYRLNNFQYMHETDTLSDEFVKYNNLKQTQTPEDYKDIFKLFTPDFTAKKTTLSLSSSSFSGLQLIKEYYKMFNIKSSYNDIFETIVKNSIKNDIPLLTIKSSNITYSKILKHCLELADDFINTIDEDKVKDLYDYVDLMSDSLDDLYCTHQNLEETSDEDKKLMNYLDELDIIDFDFDALFGIEHSLLINPVMHYFLFNNPFKDSPVVKKLLEERYPDTYVDITIDFLEYNTDLFVFILESTGKETIELVQNINDAKNKNNSKIIRNLIRTHVDIAHIKVLFVLYYYVKTARDLFNQINANFNKHMRNINSPYIQELVEYLIELKLPVVSKCGFLEIIKQYGEYIKRAKFNSSGNSLTEKQYYYLKNIVAGSEESIYNDVYTLSKFNLNFEEYTRMNFLISDRGFSLYQMLLDQENLYESLDVTTNIKTPCQPYFDMIIQPFSETTLLKLYEQFSNGGFYNETSKSKT